LNIEWRICQKSLISRYSQSLYLIASTTERFLFLTQFISSQSPLALFNVSWIFWSKNKYLMLLTVFLNCFQSATLLVNLYFSKSLLQLVFHQLFEYLKILTILEFLFQVFSKIQANKLTIFSRDLISDRLKTLMKKMSLIKSLINDISFSLSLLIEHLQLSVYYSSIGIIIVRET